MRVPLRLDLLDVERHDLGIGPSRANVVDPRLRRSGVDHDERVHLGEVVAAVLLVTLVAGNVVEEEHARSILERSDDLDLRHDRRHVRLRNELAKFHRLLDAPEVKSRHVAELGLPDPRVADERDLRGAPHFVLGLARW